MELLTSSIFKGKSIPNHIDYKPSGHGSRPTHIIIMQMSKGLTGYLPGVPTPVFLEGDAQDLNTLDLFN